MRHRSVCVPVVIGALLAAASGFARPSSARSAGYYDPVDSSSPARLRTTLHELIDDHQRFPYTSSSTDTWDILEQADEDPSDGGSILDIYRNASYAKAGGGNSNYQREHTWPSSYGFPDDNSGNYPYTDAHHLMLADGGYNASRSNLPYRGCDADCLEKPTVSDNGEGGDTGSYPGNSNWRAGSAPLGRWETWIGRRGDVARALLYLDVRYEGGTHRVTGAAEPDLIVTDNRTLIGTTGTNAAVAYMGIVSVLLRWNVQDPVDELERNRNDVVFDFQGNRNPFVDHPEWVAMLFSHLSIFQADSGADAPPVSPLITRFLPTEGAPVQVAATSPASGTTAPEAAVMLSVNVQAEEATITNRGDGALDLGGWTLVSVTGNQRFAFPSEFQLAGGTSVTVTSGRDARHAPPRYLRWTGRYIWNNDGDPGRLLDDERELVASTRG